MMKMRFLLHLIVNAMEILLLIYCALRIRVKLGRVFPPILPERGNVYCIKQDHINPDLLFVGTEFGAFSPLTGAELDKAEWFAHDCGL